jgi:hypothetical protein
MTDTRFLPGLVLVGAVALFVLATLLVLGLTRPGIRQGGLVASGLPLALLPTLVATIYVSWKVIGVMSSMAETVSGSMQMFIDASSSLWLVQRVAWGALAATSGLGLLLGLVRSGSATDGVSCSTRRAAVLVLLPVLGLVLATTVALQIARSLRVATAVVTSVEKDPESKKRTDATLAAEGLRAEGSGSLADISRFVARGTIVGTFGGAIAAVILLGLAVPGAILAWRVSFGSGFLVVSSALWLLALVAGGLVAAGVLNPLRLS